MNTKLLFCISFLVALLGHIALFNLFTFVFFIDPAGHKPKFFFLGPILSQSDVRLTSSKKLYPGEPVDHTKIRTVENKLTATGYKPIDQVKNPFAIGSIKKPLDPKAAESQNKVVIKSTFETQPEEGPGKDSEIEQRLDPDLKIQSYRPLQFRTPQETF